MSVPAPSNATPVPEDAKASSLPNVWWQLLLLASVYVLINFVLTRHALAPVHQDDYLALGYGYGDMRLLMSRPVSTNFIYLMGALGPAIAYPMLALMTMLLAFLVMRFVQRFFAVGFAWWAVLLFGAAAFSHMSSLEHTKFLGLFTNLTSHILGVSALILLCRAWGPRQIVPVALAAACYALSAFAKEDFLLPPLILIAVLAAEELRARRAGGRGFTLSRWTLAVGLGFGLLAACAVAFNFFLSNNPFVGGVAGTAPAAEPYAIAKDPLVLASAFTKLAIGFVPVLGAAMLAGIVAMAVARPAYRLRIAAYVAMVVSLILPYAMIPNNMPEYRVYSWLCWYAGAITIALAWAGERWLSPMLRPAAARFAGAMLALLVAGAVFMQANPQRQAVAGWYRAQQEVNAHMLQSLRTHRPLVAQQATVGIVGVDGPSPWSNTDAQFLHRKLYFDNKWVVFVDKDSMFFQIDPVSEGKIVPSRGKQFVAVAQTQRACLEPDLLLLVFNPAGDAVPMRAREWCKSHPAPAPVGAG